VKYINDVVEPIVGAVIRDRLGNDITAVNTFLQKIRLNVGKSGDIHTVIFEIEIPKLLKGNYSISPAIANGNLTNHEMCDWIDNAYHFEVINEETVYGMLRFPVTVRYSVKEG